MENLLVLLISFKYHILFPLAVIEGPIVTIIAGFLASSGILNIFFIYPIVVIGDVVGDTLCYSFGRFGSAFINRHGHRVGLTQEKIASVTDYFHTHSKKALFFSKMLHGIGFTGLVVAGSLKISYRKFFVTCLLISLVQSVLMILIGILFGHTYLLIGTYLNYYAAVSTTIVLLVGFIVLMKKFNIVGKP